MTSKKKDHQIKISGLDELMQEAESNIEKMEAAAGIKEEDDLGEPADWDLENMDLGAIEVLNAPVGPPSATNEDSEEVQQQAQEPKIEVPSLKEKAQEKTRQKNQRKQEQEKSQARDKKTEEDKPSAQDVVVQAMLKEKNRMVLAISRLEQEKKSYRSEKEEFRDDLVRVQANFENFRKRVTRDKKEVHRYAQDEVFKALLEVADNLDRATQIDLSEATDTERALAEKILEGVHMTLRTMEAALGKFKVESFSALESFFDPNFHEAVQQIEDDSVPEGWVLEEFQKGYHQDGRLVRPSMVVVAKGGISRTDWEVLHAPPKEAQEEITNAQEDALAAEESESKEDDAGGETHQSTDIQVDTSNESTDGEVEQVGDSAGKQVEKPDADSTESTDPDMEDEEES